MQARLIVKAKPNNMLCISSMTYKFVHWAGGTSSQKTNFPVKCCYYCAQSEGAAQSTLKWNHNSFISQILKGRSEQRTSPATREPVHQVLTEADLQQFDDNFFMRKEQKQATSSLRLLLLQLKQQE